MDEELEPRSAYGDLLERHRQWLREYLKPFEHYLPCGWVDCRIYVIFHHFVDEEPRDELREITFNRIEWDDPEFRMKVRRTLNAWGYRPPKSSCMGVIKEEIGEDIGGGSLQ